MSGSMPRLPAEGLLLISLGGLWLCLWRGPWRLLGHRPNRRRVRHHGADPAARHRDRRWRTLCRRASDRRAIISSRPVRARKSCARSLSPRPVQLAFLGRCRQRSRRAGSTAPGSGAAIARAAVLVAIVTGASALPVKCGGVDAIVSQVPAGFRCRSLMPVIDRINSWRRGAVALWLDRDGITVESVNESRGDRPWVPHPRPLRRPAAAISSLIEYPWLQYERGMPRTCWPR